MRSAWGNRTCAVGRARLSVVALVAAACVTPAAAAPVTLEDVIGAALRGGPLLQHENEKVNTAAGKLQQAQGAFDWTASAETGWEVLYAPKAENGVLTTKLDTSTAVHTTLGVGRLFRNGISVQPGVSFYTSTDISPGQSFGLTQPRPALNLNIPLWRGLGSSSPGATAETAAKANLQSAQLARNFIAQKSVHDAVQTFWRCLATRQQVQILENNARASNDYVAMLRQQAQGGQIEPTVLDRIVARQVTLQVALSNAYSADQLCQRDLVTITGIAPDGTLPIPIGELPDMEGAGTRVDSLNEAELADAALTRRLDIKALAEAEVAVTETARGAENSTQPRVDLYLDPTRILVRVVQPLGNNVADGQLAQAQASESDARINLEQLQTAVRTDISTAGRGVRTAMTNWTALHQSESLLTGVVTDAQMRLQAGVIRPEDYRDMQDELAQVQRQVIDARLQYASSLAALRLASGTVEVEGNSPAIVAALFRALPGR